MHYTVLPTPTPNKSPTPHHITTHPTPLKFKQNNKPALFSMFLQLRTCTRVASATLTRVRYAPQDTKIFSNSPLAVTRHRHSYAPLTQLRATCRYVPLAVTRHWHSYAPLAVTCHLPLHATGLVVTRHPSKAIAGPYSFALYWISTKFGHIITHKYSYILNVKYSESMQENLSN